MVQMIAELQITIAECIDVAVVPMIAVDVLSQEIDAMNLMEC